jgi:hypothetical protein
MRRQTAPGRAGLSLSGTGHQPAPSTHPPLAVGRYYNGRADCKNVIKELQAGFALPTLCLEKFWATEAALSLASLTYNLIGLFGRQLGWQQKVTLQSLRFWLFVTAGVWSHPGGKTTVKLAGPLRERDWWRRLWEKILSPSPTAMQSKTNLISLHEIQAKIIYHFPLHEFGLRWTKIYALATNLVAYSKNGFAQTGRESGADFILVHPGLDAACPAESRRLHHPVRRDHLPSRRDQPADLIGCHRGGHHQFPARLGNRKNPAQRPDHFRPERN